MKGMALIPDNGNILPTATSFTKRVRYIPEILSIYRK